MCVLHTHSMNHHASFKLVNLPFDLLHQNWMQNTKSIAFVCTSVVCLRGVRSGNLNFSWKTHCGYWWAWLWCTITIILNFISSFFCGNCSVFGRHLCFFRPFVIFIIATNFQNSFVASHFSCLGSRVCLACLVWQNTLCQNDHRWKKLPLAISHHQILSCC